MDTARAKNIIIILFVALNIFLLVNILMQVTGGDISRETLDNTRTILAERGVTFAEGVKIPVFRKDVAPVIFGEGGADLVKVESVLLGGEAASGSGAGSLEFEGNYFFRYVDPESGIKISASDMSSSGLKETQKELKKLMVQMGLPASDFVTDMQTESEVRFIYKAGNCFIFDNYILFELAEGGISAIECSYREVAGYGAPAAILPAHQVLIKNIVDCDGCVISSITLGYKSSALVWRVCFTDGTCRYLDAQ